MSREYRQLVLEAKGSASQDMRERSLTEASGRASYARTRSFGRETRRAVVRKKPSKAGLLPKRGIQKRMAKDALRYGAASSARATASRGMARSINSRDTRHTPGSALRSEAARAGVFRDQAGRSSAIAWRMNKIGGYLKARGQRGGRVRF